MFDYQIFIIVFIFGLCIGSFLNVCIYRLPESKSIVYPPSSCPKCGYMIKFYDNIPVLSYLLLRGKCRGCRTPISFRYPIVEMMSGLFAVCAVLKFGPVPEAVVYYFFICCLIVITYIDIDHQIIPDVISLPGIPVFFFLGIFFVPSLTYKDALLGILFGGGTLWLVGKAWELIKGYEGMGFGDVKLLAMIGALIGWKGILFTIFVSSLVGTVVGTALMLTMRKDFKLRIPFGPFLAIGALTYIFWGNELIYWYFNLLR
jgi:leader peptidase (prepilin peptidase)/N-methyltransferase